MQKCIMYSVWEGNILYTSMDAYNNDFLIA